MRLEAEEEMARADERAAEMQAAHEQQLEEARRAAQAEAEAAVAEAEARMAVLHEKALLADRERAGEQVDALGREASRTHQPLIALPHGTPPFAPPPSPPNP